MVGTHIYQNITRLAESLGFTACGVAAACRLEEESEHYLSAMKEGCFAEMEYLKRNCEKREDPRLLFEGAKSILAFLAPYGDESATPEKEVIFGNGTCGRYKIAQYALGEDYHRIIKEKLSAILNYIKSRIPEARGRVYTDTAPIMERAWGARAGLGFIGKNNFLISRSAGIRNFIGIIITDVEFEPVFDMSQYKNHCGECRRCIESCPTGALSPYRLDAAKCISYLTIEKKGSDIGLNKSMAGKREGWIFGCDACMNACPWNSRNRNGWNEFKPQPGAIPAAHLRRR